MQLDWHNFKYKEMKTNTGARTADFLTANLYWVTGETWQQLFYC